jgi:hypothetical protein
MTGHTIHVSSIQMYNYIIPIVIDQDRYSKNSTESDDSLQFVGNVRPDGS